MDSVHGGSVQMARQESDHAACVGRRPHGQFDGRPRRLGGYGHPQEGESSGLSAGLVVGG